MIKSELIQKIAAANPHLYHRDVERIVNVIFDEIDPKIIRQQFLNALAPCYNLIPDSTHLKGKWQAVITPASLTQLGQMIVDAKP